MLLRLLISILNTKISVAMATYNGAKYLRQQLDSILEQTLLPCQIIICDDCSGDNTLEILYEYRDLHAIVEVYSNEINLGYAKNFEKAIMLCNGDYIALSDQDDIWIPSKLEVLLANIGDNLLIHSDATLIDHNGLVLEASYFDKYKDSSKANFIDYLWLNNVTGCTAMFSSDIVQEFFPIPDKFKHHDHYLALCATYHGCLIRLIKQPLVLYRQHNNVIGAAQSGYTRFCDESIQISNIYNSLLNTSQFSNYSHEISLISKYRKSFYTNKFLSLKDYISILKLPKSIKYVMFNIFILTASKFNLAKNLYNFIRNTK